MESTETTTASKELFEPAPTARLSGFERVVLVFSLILVFGGFYVMSLAFTFHEWGIELFAAGIILDAIGLWIPFGWLAHRRGRK